MYKWKLRRAVVNSGEFQKTWGHNTSEFIAGKTNKACRHDAAKDAAVELYKCGKSENEILELLQDGFYKIKPDHEPNELENIISWVVNNVSQDD
jgi:hypothetical protein